MNRIFSILSSIFVLLILWCMPAIAQSPLLTLWGNPDYGQWTFEGASIEMIEVNVVSGDPDGIAFSWMGDASVYGESILGYRMGWDVMDPDDPDDGGWLVQDYVSWLEVDPVHFLTGTHTFLLDVMDTAGGRTRALVLIQVVDDVADANASWGSVKALYR